VVRNGRRTWERRRWRVRLHHLFNRDTASIRAYPGDSHRTGAATILRARKEKVVSMVEGEMTHKYKGRNKHVSYRSIMATLYISR